MEAEGLDDLIMCSDNEKLMSGSPKCPLGRIKSASWVMQCYPMSLRVMISHTLSSSMFHTGSDAILEAVKAWE